ncbi:MAG: hypothetical protein R2795_07245 [Saprospiraceae bacterium]
MQYLSLLLSLLLAVVANAQQTLPAGENFYDDGPAGIVYNKEFAVDFRLITPKAFGLGVSLGDIKSYHRTRFYNFEFGDIRHPWSIANDSTTRFLPPTAYPVLTFTLNKTALLCCVLASVRSVIFLKKLKCAASLLGCRGKWA